MINLFKKFSTACTTAIAVFCAFACSDKIAGTAEEPNQFAYGTSSSSSFIALNPDIPPSTSSSSGFITSSESTPIDVIPSSSSRGTAGGSEGFGNSGSCDTSAGKSTLCGHEFGTAKRSLEDYLKMYRITEVTFDTNVLANNMTFNSSRDTADIATVAELRTLGLHKITNANVAGLAYLFLETTAYMGGKVYETNGNVSFQEGGCPLYILNIVETSPAVHVLTHITKDTITVADFYDSCDYEHAPFDMHVGFLFAYCGELSESPKIERTFTLKESMACNSVVYDEFVNKNFK